MIACNYEYFLHILNILRNCKKRESCLHGKETSLFPALLVGFSSPFGGQASKPLYGSNVARAMTCNSFKGNISLPTKWQHYAKYQEL